MRLPFFKQQEKVEFDYNPSFGIDELLKTKLEEQFKGELEQKKIKFPAELGEEHPFDFKQMEELYKKFGLFSAIIDKYVDFIWGPGFYVKCDEDRAREIIEEFIKDVNFDTVGRQWTKEALIKGNGFMEIGGNKKEGIKGLKNLNANYMYVVRDKRGKIEGYNQYKGAFDRFAKNKVINFTEDEIAHVPFNIVGDCAYGIGIGYSSLKIIDNLLRQQKDLHWLMERKANAPLHAKLGKVEGGEKIIPKPEDVTQFGKDMEVMSNKTNWATDALVEFDVIDFGDIGDKFSAILEHDMEMIIYAFQIPAVLLGKANIPEGLAKVQMEAFQRRIQSIQAELEKIIEEKIFKRVLIANGLDVDIEFEWGTPSVLETEARMKLVSELMKSPGISGAMNSILEDEMINLLKLDKDKWEETKLEWEEKQEEERKRLEQQPQPIVPGQNKNFPQKVLPKKELPKQPKPEESFKKKIKHEHKKIYKNYEYEPICKDCEESWNDINDIQEWLGFNYKKYLSNIMDILSKEEFEQIKALNEIELEAGYLTEEQITKLKGILNNGFEKGKGLKDMAKEVDTKLELKDLYRMTEDGNIMKGAAGLPILAKSKEKRAIGIVRSEVTRLANKGAVKYYKDNDIKRIKHIASFGNRTCPICEGLNGTIYEIGMEPGLPVHPMCRCTYGAVVELV